MPVAATEERQHHYGLFDGRPLATRRSPVPYAAAKAGINLLTLDAGWITGVALDVAGGA